MASTPANEILERRIKIEDNYLVASLAATLQEEHRLMSPKCCIFKVPTRLREINEEAFIPKAVSIGPFHRKKLEQYEAMEKHKIHYLKQFLQRRRPSTTLEDCVKDCVRMLKGHEKRARECYANVINLTSDEFVEMMMLDGCFIIEYLLRDWKPESRGQYDPLFHHKYLKQILDDLLLLENQLPFFVLDALFNFINASDSKNLWEVSFFELALKFYVDCDDEDPSTLQEPNHLLDLIYKEWIPPQMINDGAGGEATNRTIPSATQLREAGVKIKAAPQGTYYLDIKFENGTLEIPTIKVEDQTEQLLRNLIAYEQCCGERSYMVDYFTVIDDLINSPGDVALLKRKGIIINWLGDEEEVSNMVNKMVKNVYVEKNFQYCHLYEELNDYYEIPWHKWKTKLKHDYFNTPWSIIASPQPAFFLFILSLTSQVDFRNMDEFSARHPFLSFYDTQFPKQI